MNFNKEGENLYINIALALYRANIIDKKEYISRLKFCDRFMNKKKLKRLKEYKFLCKLENTYSNYRYPRAGNRKQLTYQKLSATTAYKPKFTELNSWEFHKGDDDFFPSIPHGHLITNSKEKLDVYRGYVYIKNTPIRREPRKSIIKLWNDKKFRKFAAESIDYYLETHPHHNWRVENPRKLPKNRTLIKR